jgi:hypothetical protein
MRKVPFIGKIYLTLEKEVVTSIHGGDSTRPTQEIARIVFTNTLGGKFVYDGTAYDTFEEAYWAIIKKEMPK